MTIRLLSSSQLSETNINRCACLVGPSSAFWDFFPFNLSFFLSSFFVFKNRETRDLMNTYVFVCVCAGECVGEPICVPLLRLWVTIIGGWGCDLGRSCLFWNAGQPVNLSTPVNLSSKNPRWKSSGIPNPSQHSHPGPSPGCNAQGNNDSVFPLASTKILAHMKSWKSSWLGHCFYAVSPKHCYFWYFFYLLRYYC